MAEQSGVSVDLWLLSGIEDFRHYTLKLVQQNRRTLAILTRDLDELIFGTDEFTEALSAFSRSSRHTQIQILIKDTKPAIESNHQLIRLAQRLSSKIQVRKMTVEPNNKEMAFVLGDTDKLLYKNDESVYRGFYNSSAARELKPLREEFNYLWQYAEPEPEFQLLLI
ncbi:hypothetical protein D0C16_01720 [Cellvibrio sp. KY-GH-1]|uniref:DUF7931 domain-containing protein n=1 Tax=Cellvibrio sp. KY-GH-1 TaxID=2303332 RepID=UPI001247D8B6|nr:hypothetical protein [Cellvibrio sp. KY-GH-1]QEY14797.1 hypothetical protein D0C16_01720 [Cellvibrio sp. KY-GH-1]